jgi:RNA polymerase sigma-70 factor (ECF subfamily)
LTAIHSIKKNNRKSMENTNLVKESKAVKLFSDHEVLFKEQTGNDFTFFYKKYYPKLIYYTSKICGDEQKAEDVTTQAFMDAFDKIESYKREKSQFSTWLFTIARNIALQDLKSTRKTMSLDVELDEEGTTMKDFIQEEEDLTHIPDVIEMKANIMKKHISELKEPYKQVIEMREIQKMAYKDIADLLQENLSTIKSRIRNGRAILINNSKKEFDLLDEMYM